MCPVWILWIHLTWSVLSLFNVYIHVFHIWEVFSHYFLKFSLLPSLSFLILGLLPSLSVLILGLLFDSECYMGSLGSINFNIFFYFLDLIISIVLYSSLQLIFSACSNLPSNPHSKFLFQLLYFSVLKLPLCFLFEINFSFVLNVFVVAYWSIFMMAVLKSLPDNSSPCGI